MKKILTILILFISLLWLTFSVQAEEATTNTDKPKECGYDIDSEDALSLWDALDSCLSKTELVNWSDAQIDWKWWFWNKIKTLVNNISLYLWIFAVGSIVLWSLMLTLSAWEEEKVTKAKNIVKWGIIGFLWVLTASAIINLIVKIMYSI